MSEIKNNSPEPIEAKYRQFLNDIAGDLDDILNGANCPREEKKTGFFMFVFDFNKGPEEGRMNYISNADRLDVLAALKSMVAQTEARIAEKNNGGK